MAKFLEQWYNAIEAFEATKAPTDWDAFVAEQQDFIVETIITARYAYSIPRRLGADATTVELATDKRFSKLLAVRMQSILKQWGQDLTHVEAFVMAEGSAKTVERLRALGAQVIWTEWFPVYAEHRRNALRFVANRTFLQEKATEKLGNSYAQRLFNELTQINQIYTQSFDIPTTSEESKKLTGN